MLEKHLLNDSVLIVELGSSKNFARARWGMRKRSKEGSDDDGGFIEVDRVER